MYESHDWHAWYDEMPGTDDPRLHVTGIVSIPSSAITLQLEPGNPGINPDDTLMVLDLVATVPEFGDDRWTEREVTWVDDVGPGKKHVRIQRSAQATIEVGIVVTASDG